MIYLLMISVSSQRRRRQGGSTTVEFGMVLLPLLAILFMMIDIAWILLGWACIQEGAREGVRYAITGSGQSESALNTSTKAVVQKYSFGFAQANKIVIHYYPPNGYSSGTTPAALDGTGSATSAGNIVTVIVPAVSLKSFGPIFRAASIVNVSASASDVLQ
jgi:Flp pilus assembly protein TadG